MKKKITKMLLVLAAILLVASSSTTIALASVLNQYNMNDKGAIEIAPVSWYDQTVSFPETEEEKTVSSGETFFKDYFSAETLNSSNYTSAGFTVTDENEVVWETETEVEIFKVAYENGEGYVTAKSFNGEKIVAPGTENSYLFKLKNSGDTEITYTLNVDAFITPGDNMIPIEARISRYDEEWIVGGPDEWVDVPTLDTAADEASLSPDRYTYYTLDWRWPFESGNDEYDTFLGNLAVEEDITITIVISTTATAEESAPGTDPDDPDSPDEPGGGEGLVPPDTGDNSILSIWISLAVGAAVFLIIILVYKIREEKRSKTEASKN